MRLGSGAYAVVIGHEGRAYKLCDEGTTTARELRLLRRGACDGLVPMLACGAGSSSLPFDAASHDVVAWIAMPQATCDMNRWMRGRTSPAQRARVVAGACAAVEALHARGVMHRDIKSANLLLFGDTVKLCDLGLGRCVGDHGAPRRKRARGGGRAAGAGAPLTGVVQTVWYRAPEVELRLNYGYAADVWGLACVAHELLLTGRDVLFECGASAAGSAEDEALTRALRTGELTRADAAQRSASRDGLITSMATRGVFVDTAAEVRRAAEGGAVGAHVLHVASMYGALRCAERPGTGCAPRLAPILEWLTARHGADHGAALAEALNPIPDRRPTAGELRLRFAPRGAAPTPPAAAGAPCACGCMDPCLGAALAACRE